MCYRNPCIRISGWSVELVWVILQDMHGRPYLIRLAHCRLHRGYSVQVRQWRCELYLMWWALYIPSYVTDFWDFPQKRNGNPQGGWDGIKSVDHPVPPTLFAEIKACGRLPGWQIPWYDFCQILRLRMSWLHESVCVRIIQECAGYHPEGQTSKCWTSSISMPGNTNRNSSPPQRQTSLFRLLPCKQSGKCAENFIPRHHARKYSFSPWFEKCRYPQWQQSGSVIYAACIWKYMFPDAYTSANGWKRPVRGSVDAICSSSRL